MQVSICEWLEWPSTYLGWCRQDNIFIAKNGKQKMFHVRSNSLCHQYIQSHYELYTQHCKELSIQEHHYAVLWSLVWEHQARGQGKAVSWSCRECSKRQQSKVFKSGGHEDGVKMIEQLTKGVRHTCPGPSKGRGGARYFAPKGTQGKGGVGRKSRTEG